MCQGQPYDYNLVNIILIDDMFWSNYVQKQYTQHGKAIPFSSNYRSNFVTAVRQYITPAATTLSTDSSLKNYWLKVPPALTKYKLAKINSLVYESVKVCILFAN